MMDPQNLRWRGRLRVGFTLVELLVVIGIIAVLLGILLPSLRAARQQAQMTACQSNLRQIFYGLTMYANDNRDRFPDTKTLGRHGFRAAVGRTMPGRSPFAECYGLPALLHGIEPGAQKVFPLPKPRYLDGDSNVWICPTAPDRITKWGNSYAWTLWETDNNPPAIKRNPKVDFNSMQRHRSVINDPEYLKYDRAQMRGGIETFVFDNVSFGAGLTGFMGKFTGTSGDDPYTFPTKIYTHANYRKGYRGAINGLAINGEVFAQLVGQ